MSIRFNTAILENTSAPIAERNEISSQFRYTDETFFFSAIDFVSSLREEYDNSKMILYSVLSESTSQEVVNESFSEFFDKAKEIIRKFIDWIKNLVERFITTLHKIIKSDKYIKKHKEDFSKFSDKHEFTMNMYTYTFSSNVPVITAQASFDKIYHDIEQVATDSVKEDQKNRAEKLKKIYDDFCDGLEDSYDELRASVIGVTGKIYQSEYSQELFDVYRDGGHKGNTTITASIVNNSYMRFDRYDDTLKDVKKKRDEIEKEYKAVEKKLDHMKSVDNKKLVLTGSSYKYTSGYELTDDMSNTWDLYIKAHVDKIVNMASIHALAFSAKLDALKECYRQDKTILYNALQRIQKMALKEQEELELEAALLGLDIQHKEEK